MEDVSVNCVKIANARLDRFMKLEIFFIVWLIKWIITYRRKACHVSSTPISGLDVLHFQLYRPF